MGSRGASSGRGSGGAGGPTYKGELKLPDGSKIEFDGDLKYGKKDSALSQAQRKNIEAWEKKRVKNKIEYAYAVDENGNQIWTEVRGGKGSVGTPIFMHGPNSVFTHNHPRGNGMLGGTFSDADLYGFARTANKTTRATAKEGTYSISKTSKFDKAGFTNFVADANRQFSKKYRFYQNKTNDKYKSGKINYEQYKKECAKAFNTSLIELHNLYASQQKTFGYTYTLEQ